MTSLLRDVWQDNEVLLAFAARRAFFLLRSCTRNDEVSLLGQ
jgi:hypothetical protein